MHGFALRPDFSGGTASSAALRAEPPFLNALGSGAGQEPHVKMVGGGVWRVRGRGPGLGRAVTA